MIDLDSPEDFLQRRMRSVDRRRLLQPRTSMQILDFSTRTYHKLAWPILRLTLPSMVLLYAGLIFFQGFVLPGLLTTSAPGDVKIQFTELMFVYMVALFVALPVVVVALSYCVGLTTRVVSRYVVEQKIDPFDALQGARKGAVTMVSLLMQVFLRAGAVLMASGALLLVSAYSKQEGGDADLTTFFAVIGFIASVIMVPTVFFSLALAPAVAAVEGASPREAMRRGKALLRRSRHIGSGYDTLINLTVVTFFFALLLWLGFYSAFGMTGLAGYFDDLAGKGVLWAIVGQTIQTFPTFAAVWLLVPYAACCVTVLYYDRRVRLEALDIETMAHDVVKGAQQADLRL